jgi:hypothetical protein
MALKKSEKKMLIFLGVVVVGAGIYQFVIFPGQQKKEQAEVMQQRQAAARTEPVRSQPQLVQRAAAPEIDLPVQIPEDWGKDPFRVEETRRTRPVETSQIRRQPETAVSRPSPAEPRPQIEIKPPALQGIFHTNAKTLALIDGMLLSEGEEKEGIALIEIRENEVICRKNNRIFTLHRR